MKPKTDVLKFRKRTRQHNPWDDLSLVLPAWVYPTLDWMFPFFRGHIQHRWAKMGFLARETSWSSDIHTSTYINMIFKAHISVQFSLGQADSSGVKELIASGRKARIKFPMRLKLFLIRLSPWTIFWQETNIITWQRIWVCQIVRVTNLNSIRHYTTASDPRFQPTTRASAWKRVVRSTWSSALAHHSSPQVVLRPLIMALLYRAGTTGMVGHVDIGSDKELIGCVGSLGSRQMWHDPTEISFLCMLGWKITRFLCDFHSDPGMCCYKTLDSTNALCPLLGFFLASSWRKQGISWRLRA